MIHKTAIIDSSASISSNVKIGAYAIIDKNVSIDEGTVIKEHAVIRENTFLGKNNIVYQNSSIGERPQDLKFKNEKTTCTIGDNNIFRENCSIHRGTKDGISDTNIGNNNLFMAYTHVAHDCIIHDGCILSNAASLAGHVEVESNVSLGGFTLVHQFCRIGMYAFSGLGTVISQDVTPYTLIAGNHAKAYKINAEGLKRKNFNEEDIKKLEKCFKIFIRSSKPLKEKINLFKNLNINSECSNYFVDFIKNSRRGVTR
ncbi:MAG: acyl-ACP--UDP-N-acetylglucosamine O-acyltransferase [Gammaproteobacteria bacterium]|jgi:UDP-N-acetylglucosamine acyltransferase|nr:acyl-ACP--UDP-N-acetylglucosamine O-acyltransferase [Gammaproteobacteria bacterium]